MQNKEGFFRSIAHIPGDYVRGMDSMSNSGWLTNAAVAHTFVGFMGGGMTGLIGSFAVDAFEHANKLVANTNAGIGWWVGVGLINLGLTTLAIIDGHSVRKNTQNTSTL